MIKIQRLSFQYPNGTEVLHDISFTVKKGEFVALIGQNGAGKTTLLKQFNGLLKPSAGDVFVDGQSTKETNTGNLARRVGYLFQNPDHQIFNPTVEKEIGFGPRNLGFSKSEIENRVRDAAEQVGLMPYMDENPLFLSKGQRQRVAFASLLSMRPEVMVLDEPTTGQDYREGIEIMDMVKNLNREGHTIIFVTHDMELVAQYADRVVVLSQGRVLADDSSRNVFYQPELLYQTKLFPPQIARLAQKFANHPLESGKAISVVEIYGQLMEMVERERNVSNR